MDIAALVEKQKTYFRTGATRDLAFRKRMLQKLYDTIRAQEGALHEALEQDLGKSAVESYMCETGMTLGEIRYMKKHLSGYARRKYAMTPLAQFPSMSYILKEPYGTVLIMSPWNYPFMLDMAPLADAIAAGKTEVLTPSAYAPRTSAVISQIVSTVFPEEYVAVVQGGRAENTDLLEQQFDYIFFTGGVNVGRLVLEKAAQHCTPVTLELGGKSPCIVDEPADLNVTAQRIAFGKYLNCGQTCVAPDYLLIQESVRDRFLPILEETIQKMYGEAPLNNGNYGKIINQKHYQRLCEILEHEIICFGGQTKPETLQIATTNVSPVEAAGTAMSQEIFGPILPVVAYRTLDEAISYVSQRPRPLALYIFSKNRAAIRRVQSELSYGGGCVNDTIIHLATSEMGFGGVGLSGMGSYHGKRGFDTFTHEKSTVDKALWLDLPFRYQPYAGWKDWFIRLFLR